MATKMECCICLCDFKNPKIIDCFHTFCKTCLDDYISSKSENGHFPCPICRKDITIPEQFTTNFYVAHQAEVSESTTDDDKGESESRMCSNHMKEIDLYCKRCSVSMCYKCFIADHNGHSVSNLKDFKLQIQMEIKELKRELGKTLLKYERYSESIQHQKNEIKTQTSQICTRIDNRVEKLCAALRNIGRLMKDQVKQSQCQAEKETTRLEPLADDLSKATKKLVKEVTDDVDHIGVSELLVLKTKLVCEIKNGKQDLVVPEPNLPLFQEGEMNEIQLTNQLGQLKPSKKKNDTKTASSNNLSNSVTTRDENSELVINKSCIFQFTLNKGKQINYIGTEVFNHCGLCWWRFASNRNNKLSLQLQIRESITGPLPNKLLIKLELLNKRNHQLNKIKQLIIQVKETYYWKDIINMDELKDLTGGYTDGQCVFTFRLVVLYVTPTI